MNRSTDNPCTESVPQVGLEKTSRQDQPAQRKTWQKPILKKLDMRETLLGNGITPDGGGPGYS